MASEIGIDPINPRSSLTLNLTSALTLTIFPRHPRPTIHDYDNDSDNDSDEDWGWEEEVTERKKGGRPDVALELMS